MLSIRNFTKRYGEKTAVKNLSLEIAPGDIYGFIGRNGAGKTTTLKACCGILGFDEGEILIDGVSIKENPLECKRKIAYVPDSPASYEFLSGIKYLNFIADVYRLSKTEREEKIKRYSEAFELSDSLAENVGSYSHGTKQKLAIVAALIHSPKLLILDEPFVGLDPKASHTLKLVMSELCSQGGSVFFSTHVLEVAEKLCNKIAIIKQGSLVANGGTSEVAGNATLEDVFLELEGGDV